MNIITKKCLFITPMGVEMKLTSGITLRSSSKAVSFASTREILTALNAGIRIFEIGADGKRVQIDKFNFDKINVNMAYDVVNEEKEEETPAEEAATPVEEVPVEEPVQEDPADSESPEEDEPEEETEQEDPEAKYYTDSEDDCDEEKENSEDDEYID